MVIEDLINKNQNSFKMASIQDRVLSFFFDLIIFVPLFSVFLSPLFKRIELLKYTSPGSTEYKIYFFTILFLELFLIFLTQALFHFFFSWTPGKYFLKLRVISMSQEAMTDRKLRLTQSLLRSFIWVIELVFLAIPFAEVFSHRQRRPLHDRAAETIVVTLKSEGDPGPKLFETEATRRVILALTMGVFIWVVIISFYIFNLANKSEFKKSELVEEGYLCDEVTQFSEKGTNRIDLATALYLVGKINSECLLSESDFAYWSTDESLISWADFSRGVYYHFDKEKQSQYFQRACEKDKNGTPCQLSFIFRKKSISDKKIAVVSDNKSNQGLDSALSYLVFSIQQNNLLGQYSQSEYFLNKLVSSSSAFTQYYQIEKIKLYRINDQTKESFGAYEAVYQALDKQEKLKISSWMCLEDLDSSCTNKKYSFCENLKDLASHTNLDNEAIVALVREKECKGLESPNILTLSDYLANDSALNLFIKAISNETQISESKRLEMLRDLAFSIEKANGRFIQTQALRALLNKTNDVHDYQLAMDYLSQTKLNDFNWKNAIKIILKNKKNILTSNQVAEFHKIVENTQSLQLKHSNRLPASEEK